MHVRNGHQSRLTALGRVVLPGEWGKVMGQNCLGWEWGLAEGEHVLCSISFWVLIQGRLWLPIKLKALEGRRSSTNRRSLSHVQLFLTPWTAVCQAPLRMEFSRQESWSGLPFPPPRDLPDPGIEPTSLASPALTGRAVYPWASWEAYWGRHSRWM